MRHSLSVSVAALAAALLVALPGQAIGALGHDHGLPNVDTRDGERASVDAATRSARRSLAKELGGSGEVVTDGPSGGVAYAGSTAELLTGRSGAPATEIVLGYLREQRDAFGLSKQDLANLQLVARSVSPDGIEHLRFNQVLAGILSFDSGIDAHVTSDGRLISISGAPVPGASLTAAERKPALTATAGLRAARAAIDSNELPPRITSVQADAAKTTTFASGERAVLRWAATADGPLLAWNLLASDGAGRHYDVLIDAEGGDLVRRQSLTSHLGQARYFQADPQATPVPTQITMPPAWFDDHAGGSRLWGQYSRTYIDPFDFNPSPGDELTPDVRQIPASGGAPGSPDWLYSQTLFPGAANCAPSGCTWNSAVPGSETTNERQAATNVHVLTSRFHDHLQQAPIGFDEASGNFQRANPSGQGFGGDYVRAEVNDGGGINNANFFTPPDGAAPRMQMYLFDIRNNNGSDLADIVYHEYGHGLSHRLVVNASGAATLTSLQPRMMGEAWSDFYALDLLVHEGHVTDTAAPGELSVGAYAVGPGGIRDKLADCPVDGTGPTPACNGNGTGAVVLGGYTYGDLQFTNNGSPHNGGEVWTQTLWDIRTAVGRQAALSLITGGMRISRDDPSMLDMRDAILQQAIATRSAPGAADDYYDELWTIFATRGMGVGASTPDSDATNPTQHFGVPGGLSAGTPTFSDPYPGGDNDGAIEAGEEIQISQPVTGPGISDVTGVTGTLSAAVPTQVIDGSASWPLLGRARTATNQDPLVVRVPAGQCAAPTTLSLELSSSEGSALGISELDPRLGSRTTVAIADLSTAEASFEVSASGTVADVDLRIDELRHTFVGDLKITLEHAGVAATVLDQPNGGAYSGDDIVGAIFDSDAGPMSLPPSGPISGRGRPAVANALDAFDGLPAGGTWRLKITDAVAGDTGELRRWGLDSPQLGCGRVEIPVAETAGASDLTPDAATVSGLVTPNGRSTGLRFAFGKTPAYGSTTAVQDVGSGDAPVARSSALTGLELGTTYHYRVETIRENGQVAVVGADRTFVTPVQRALPPPAIDGTAPLVSDPRVTLKKVSRKSTRRRATIALTLSEPATVAALITRPKAGIVKGKACVKVPARRPKKAKKCTRQLPAAGTTVTLPAGRVQLTLPPGGLKKGTYRVSLTATDPAGNVSLPANRRFSVK